MMEPVFLEKFVEYTGVFNLQMPQPDSKYGEDGGGGVARRVVTRS